MSTVASAQPPAEVSGGEPDAVIHTEDLTKIYPGTDFAAVDKLNLDVRAGEIFVWENLYFHGRLAQRLMVARAIFHRAVGLRNFRRRVLS